LAILELSVMYGLDRPGSVEIVPPVSYEDLAGLTGMTLESVNRFITAWREQGAIVTTHSTFDPQLIRDSIRVHLRVASRNSRQIWPAIGFVRRSGATYSDVALFLPFFAFGRLIPQPRCQRISTFASQCLDQCAIKLTERSARQNR
jgi:hypothetical protein